MIAPTQKIAVQIDPWSMLALAVLQQAKTDAKDGDGIALLWLLTDGLLYADVLVRDGAKWVEHWAHRLIGRR